MTTLRPLAAQAGIDPATRRDAFPPIPIQQQPGQKPALTPPVSITNAFRVVAH